MVRVLIGGDTCPVGINMPLFKAGDADGIFGDLLPEFRDAGLSIVNLECPLVDQPSPIEKIGVALRADSDCIRGLSNAGIGVIGLANNHILDQGPAGLDSTLNACRKAGIPTVGAGRNLEEARRILVQEVAGVRIGIMAVAEHEFSIASESSPGANPLDMISFVRQMSECRSEMEYLIVLLHGGTESYPLPSPRLMETCRFMIEQGANAVLCQHSHCVGCCEQYRGGHIVYGQGNLIFDFPGHGKTWHEGFLVRLDIEDDFSSRMDVVPYVQSHEKPGAHRMDREAEEALLDVLRDRSIAILDPAFVKKEWVDFSRRRRGFYLSQFLCRNERFEKLNKDARLVRLMYSKQNLMTIQNIIRCEAHRDVLQTAFDTLWEDESKPGSR